MISLPWWAKLILKKFLIAAKPFLDKQLGPELEVIVTQVLLYVIGSDDQQAAVLKVRSVLEIGGIGPGGLKKI